MTSVGWTDMFWTSGDGLRLYYRDYEGPSDRPPLLCLHGLTRNSRDFEDFAARYGGSWRVIAPDFRGRGRSAWDPSPANYTPAVYAQDVLDLLELLSVERCIFIGTSLGGLVTMAVAAADPPRVAAAVLNDVGPELDPAGLERIATYVGQPASFTNWGDAALAVSKSNAAAHPDYGADDWERMARRLCVEWDGAIRYDYDPAIAQNFHAARQAPLGDAWPILAALHGCPILILRGAHSDLLAPQVAERMVAAHPDAELVTVPGVGHAPDLSEPAARTAISRVLTRIRLS